ncbi:hypothetical protein N7510_000656 [Penicillium lagena]|uniref:uncharacterized protein n=1 Tax=Penicillium lagena TaxID=94218 RepID=UPI00254171AE|nr:uncharacterized protein N7510_000656 [Penicillium lagena]KAJ5624347.1 hypothetical protein N7510_000656 [Penicillium lagena]
MDTRIKLGVIMLLGLGVLFMAHFLFSSRAATASVVRTYHVHVLGKPNNDPTAATVGLDCCLYIETGLIIIAASIPCIRSLFRKRKGANRTNSFEFSTNAGYSSRVHYRKGQDLFDEELCACQNTTSQDDICED